MKAIVRSASFTWYNVERNWVTNSPGLIPSQNADKIDAMKMLVPVALSQLKVYLADSGFVARPDSSTSCATAIAGRFDHLIERLGSSHY